MNNKVKLYKNKNRGKVEVRKNYVPQYQLFGIEPTEIKSSVIPQNMIRDKEDLDSNNPRNRKVAVRQPYANSKDSKNNFNVPPPNVGNNVEQTWSSVDGQYIDDVSIDDSFSENEQNSHITNENSFNNEDELFPIVSDLGDDDYLLIVSGRPLCSGPLLEIQDQARALVFGEHELCDGTEIPVDDLIILKKVKIKMGLFLE